MICKNCGKEIGDQSKFCMYCGQRVNSDYDDCIEYSLQSETDLPSEQNEYLNSHLYDKTDQHHSKKKNIKLNKAIWAVLIIFLAIGVAVNHSYSSNTKELTVDESELPVEGNQADILMCKPEALTQANNVMNGGRMAVGSDHFYYVNNDENIIQCNLDMSESMVIVRDSCMYLNVYNDLLIYCDQNYAIHQFNLKTGYNSILVDTASYYLTLVDDCIYYQNDPDGETIYCYNITEGTNNKLNDVQSYNIYVQENNLYYSTQDAIYKMNLETKENEKIIDGHAYSYTVYNDNTIFYLDNEDLYLHFYNLDTKEDSVLLDVEIYEYIYNDDKIYFRASSDYNNQLGYYDLTSTETYSFGVSGQYIQSAGQYLLYYDADLQPNIIDTLRNTDTQLDCGSEGQTL